MEASIDKATRKKVLFSYLFLLFPFGLMIFGLTVLFGAVEYPKECISSSRYGFWCQLENEIYEFTGRPPIGFGYIFVGGLFTVIVLKHIGRLKSIIK